MIIHAQGVDGHKPEHLVAAFKADGYSISFEKSGVVPTLNGNLMNDKMGKPLIFEDVFIGWAEENNYFVKFESMNDVYKHMEENDIDPLGIKGLKLQKDFNESQGTA